MKPWVPTLRIAKYLHFAAWISFVGLVVVAGLLESERITLPAFALFGGIPLALFLCWPAISVVAVRGERSRRVPFLRRLWKAFFAGTPVALAVFAIIYFYAIGIWFQVAQVLKRIQPRPVSELGPWAVGFFALPSVFVLLAAVILFGYLRVGIDGAEGI
ncbi:MAG: hypothetical protein LC130_28710 [Bryobacterales bacterium]|nr:hypothetical protein [Gammaproteobacteria bacterium]MCZ2078968.1 hypothetical protein [Bryobacterales bacterium]GIK36109.1 MAG: hypothetical protein BroJett010_26680 [Gammaproteobacteria bacterium]